jgi:hypothetical protein
MSEQIEDQRQANAKKLQLALDEAKDAIEKAFGVASSDQISLLLAHKYFHSTVDQVNTLATLKFASTMPLQQPPFGGAEDYHSHG